MDPYARSRYHGSQSVSPTARHEARMGIRPSDAFTRPPKRESVLYEHATIIVNAP